MMREESKRAETQRARRSATAFLSGTKSGLGQAGHPGNCTVRGIPLQRVTLTEIIIAFV